MADRSTQSVSCRPYPIMLVNQYRLPNESVLVHNCGRGDGEKSKEPRRLFTYSRRKETEPMKGFTVSTCKEMETNKCRRWTRIRSLTITVSCC